VDRRRQELVRLLERRRRRVRLLLFCAATALACGFVAVAAGPQMLIGGMSAAAAPVAAVPAAADAARTARAAAPPPSPLALSDRLRLDPRETQANAIRWAGMTEAERRAILARYWHLASMTPDDLDRLLEQYAAFRDLPEGRQESLRAQARKLHQFIQSLSPQDQAVLESMNDWDRAQRLLQLWQARHKTW
jgi:hypothetical protein